MGLQVQMLLKEFQIDKYWTREEIAKIALKTNLSEHQVYKWAWDQRKKFIPRGKDQTRKHTNCIK
jgi:hypothetical protein